MQRIGEKTEVFRFEDYVVNAKTRVLARDGETIALTPRVFDTLLAFVRRPGETITKDELMTAIWPDSFVEEANLAQNVAVLRKALGDSSRVHRFIVTVPGTGYRFVPDVFEVREDQLEAGGQSDLMSSPPDETAPSAHVEKSRGLALPILGFTALAVAAIAAYFFLLSPSSATVPSVARTRQVTSFSGLDIYPAFAPNGNLVAFSSNRTGAFEIYVRQLVQGATEIQLTSDGGHNLQPSFSPDGTRIAYHSIVRGGIWAIPSSGGTPKRLTDFGSNPAWSPDGDVIVFQSDPLNDFGSGVRSAMPPSTLWTVTPDGSAAPTQLTTVGTPSGGHGSPEWSPDGKRIVFDTSDWASSYIWSIGADGTGLTQLLSDTESTPRDRWVTGSDAVFSKDGRSLYFVADMGLSIQSVDIDSIGRATAAPRKIADASGARMRFIAVAPDGKQILYSAISTSSNLLLTNIGPDGASGPIELTRNRDARAVSPSFSPDGSKIVYQEYTTGSSANIKLIDTDGNNSKQITTTIAFNPWWFPTGDRIGFSVPRGSHSEYWFAAADGSVEKKLLDYDDTDIFNGRLTADGRSVLFNSKRSGTINVWRIPVEGGEATQLTFDAELAGFPAMSRDGKWIALQLKRGANTHVAYMPAEGGEIIQLTNEPGQSWVNDWAPDNDRIIFAGRRGTIWNVYTVSLSTRKVEQLTSFDKLNSYVRYPAWSPAGDKIAYEYAESTGNVWMLELN